MQIRTIAALGTALAAAALVLGLLPGPVVGAEGDETFDVAVANGYGSGAYEPGETVHVWSAASTSTAVVRPWSGDADLLDEPEEWASTFVMPARDVTLVAETEPVDMQLTVEQFTGVTNRPKTVRHHFPGEMRGVVLMSHGTGGSSSFIEGDEAFALALGLVEAGYGVIATEAEEVAAGDLNGDGKIRWQGGYSAQNVDLGNVDALLADFAARGLVPAGTAKFALGMSAGGSFSHRLGTVSGTDAAEVFPHLMFNGVISYCADATGTLSAFWSTTPSAWFMCGEDDNAEVSNVEAASNEATLAGRGIPTQYHEHQPTPLYDERFTRVDGISVETSTAMAAELRAAGFVGAGGFLTTSGNDMAAAIGADPARFAVITAQTGSLRALRAQLRVMRAEHTMYADATARTIAFFDQYLDPAATPFGSWGALVTRVTVDLTSIRPTPTQLSTWIAALRVGEATPADLVEALRAGDDNTTNVDPAVRLYRAFLGRTPDAGGLEFWVGRRRTGAWTLVRTADHFAASTEFIRRYGNLSNRQYVTRLYTDVLEREADPGGVDYWTRQLDLRRRNRGSVMVGFSESSEFMRLQIANTDVAVAYIFLLGRAPSNTEVSAWIIRHEAGTPRAEQAGELLGSSEYRNHVIG